MKKLATSGLAFRSPDSNFTETLLSNNHKGVCFLLKSQAPGFEFPGHYLSEIGEAGQLTVLKLPTIGEEIEVYLQNFVHDTGFWKV